jgi:hypothetical protein
MTTAWRQKSIVLAATAAALIAAPDRAAPASFDGNWSLLVITENGGCDPAYRYPIKVQNGQVRYEGEAGIEVSGNVRPDGKVNASVHRGEQGATGNGRLTQNSGSGTWAGRSSSSECSGRWEAERR